MKRILIVDDEPEIRSIVTKTLEMGLNTVFQAETGSQAIEIARTEKPDLIIMDIEMPGSIDGLDATRILKNDPETQKCAIIVLTGKAQEGDREKALSAGAESYFEKPFSPLELLNKVEEIIGV